MRIHRPCPYACMFPRLAVELSRKASASANCGGYGGGLPNFGADPVICLSPENWHGREWHKLMDVPAQESSSSMVSRDLAHIDQSRPSQHPATAKRETTRLFPTCMAPKCRHDPWFCAFMTVGDQSQRRCKTRNGHAPQCDQTSDHTGIPNISNRISNPLG